MFGPFLFLFFSVCREMNAVGARIPDDNYELNFVICDLWWWWCYLVGCDKINTCTRCVDLFVPVCFEEALKVSCEQFRIKNQIDNNKYNKNNLVCPYPSCCQVDESPKNKRDGSPQCQACNLDEQLWAWHNFNMLSQVRNLDPNINEAKLQIQTNQNDRWTMNLPLTQGWAGEWRCDRSA